MSHARFFVTGADGQLGSDIVPMLRDLSREVVPSTQRDLDLTRADDIKVRLREERPDWIVNCAAYTQVDRAEDDAEIAYRVNRDAVRAIAEAALECGARVAHVSTDYVFDGSRAAPHGEDDPVNPQSVYGKSKWEGEVALRTLLPDALIVRTAWVYGVRGQNFVKTMLRLAAERDRLSVVDDQIGTPTWSRDLARALVEMIRRDEKGTFHFTGEGVASWYDFTCAILEEAGLLGYEIVAGQVLPVDTRAFPRPAPRPASALLSKRKVRECLAQPIPHWRTSLREMLKELKECDDCS